MNQKFKRYIESKGVENIAALCSCTPRAVESWRYGVRRPRPYMAPVILADSNGELTWEDIYAPAPRDPVAA